MGVAPFKWKNEKKSEIGKVVVHNSPYNWMTVAVKLAEQNNTGEGVQKI